MQVKDKKNIDKRSTHYLAKILSDESQTRGRQKSNKNNTRTFKIRNVNRAN